MIETGLLKERIRFEKRTETDDGYGNKEGHWIVEFIVWAAKRNLTGGETVMANRLAGRQPAVITVRNAMWTRQISTDWRAIDVRTGEIYNVRACTPSQDHAHIDILCETGVASG